MSLLFSMNGSRTLRHRLTGQCAALGTALTLALAGLGGCVAEDNVSDLGIDSPLTAEQLSEAERILRSMGKALQDPNMRQLIFEAMQASEVKEGKLHLSKFLDEQGGELVDGMTDGTMPTEDALAILRSLIATTGELEIYLPVPEHRAAWQGGDELIVAIQLDEEEAPLGVDLDGVPFELSLEGPPELPVLSIVPVESFKADGTPEERDTATMMRRGNQLLNTSGQWTGLWINEVHVTKDYEGWTKGNPEFEFYLQNANTRQNIVCSEEKLSIEPYRFDMDDDDYYKPFLLADEVDMAEGVPFVIVMYENDDDRCEIKDKKDYIKLATDAITNGAEVARAFAEKRYTDGQWVVHLVNAVAAVISIAKSNDDFVGVASATGLISAQPTRIVLKNEKQAHTGWLMMQWKTDRPYEE